MISFSSVAFKLASFGCQTALPKAKVHHIEKKYPSANMKVSNLNFINVKVTYASMVGTSFLNLLTRTIRFPPFLSPLTGFSTKVGFLAAA